jgi:hypothetical protein
MRRRVVPVLLLFLSLGGWIMLFMEQLLLVLCDSAKVVQLRMWLSFSRFFSSGQDLGSATLHGSGSCHATPRL